MNQNPQSGLLGEETDELVEHYSQPHYKSYLNNIQYFHKQQQKVKGLHPEYQIIIDDMIDDELIVVKDDVIGRITDRGLAVLDLIKNIHLVQI